LRYKLRDEIQRGLAVREFRATIFALLAVGGAAGLFVDLLLESRLLSLAGTRGTTDWAVRGAAAFAAGFSEALFLGVVRRVGGSVDSPPRRD
jgi:hypothetical protein